MDNPHFDILESRLLLDGAPPLMGDANRDDFVDYNDLQIVCNNFGITNGTWEQGDFNNDGLVDAFDYITVKNNIGNIREISAYDRDDIIYAFGTQGDDQFDVFKDAEGIWINDMLFANADNYNNIWIESFGGNDIIKVDYSITEKTYLLSGPGDDKIYENSQGESIVEAGDGDDLIVTIGGGHDILEGGNGIDSYWFDSSDYATHVSEEEISLLSVHEVIEFVSPYESETISLEISGQNFTDPATSYPYNNNYSNYSLFGNGIKYNDAKQGNLGDCYYIATLSSLALTNPEVIYQSITELGDGTYAIRFFRSGTERYYRLDADLPGNFSPVYAKIINGSIWAPLLEKAYCFFRYGQNSYNSISGGWMTTPLYELTNKGTNTQFVSTTIREQVITFIIDALNNEYAISAGTHSDNIAPIIGAHAYVIMDLYTDDINTYVKLYNPWGNVLTVDIDVFLGSFSALVVCLL